MTAPGITSSDGTRLAALTAGDRAAPPILLIHGWAQHSICWRPVMERLQDRFFLVAMDLRGHGASDQPADTAAYTQTRLWGDDIAAMIAAFGMEKPLLAGWSYGSRVIEAYLHTHGADAISGVALAGGILAIGKSREGWMAGDSSPGLDRDLYTDDQVRRLSATARFVSACTARPLDRQTYGELVGANMLVPAHVRRALFAADRDLRPGYASMPCPGLVIHGTADQVVTPATGEAAAGLMPRGRYLPYEGLGHAPFLEAPERFARDLAEFALHCRAEETA